MKQEVILMTKKSKYFFLNISILVLLIIMISSGFRLIQRKSSEKEVSGLLALRSSENFEASELIEADPIEVYNEQPEIKYDYKPNKNSEYLAINSDFTGWITIADTVIDYPIVRGSDNEFYLNRNIYKKSSDAGAIFMDYRNIGQFNDQHTIIYGHYMKNGTMFGGLHEYKEETYFKTHDKIKLSGLYGEKTYTIFSVYIVSADDYKLEIDFIGGNYENYVQSLWSISMHKKDFIFNEDKALLTLATCSYELENGRIVIHAIED